MLCLKSRTFVASGVAIFRRACSRPRSKCVPSAHGCPGIHISCTVQPLQDFDDLEHLETSSVSHLTSQSAFSMCCITISE